MSAKPRITANAMSATLHIETRLRCIEVATQLAIAKNKPSHAVYIAADLYEFIISGEKPEGPPDRQQEQVKPEFTIEVRKT